MENLKGKVAVVIGASSGVGRATLVALAAQGARVIGVARDGERLGRVVQEAQGDVVALAADATRRDVIARLVTEEAPSIIVVSAGLSPRLAPLDEHTWESFSAPWNTDVKIAFDVCQEALRRPLAPGSVVVLVSSGAAIAGSPLSGGYAGAKRTQWFVADYAQRASVARKLGIRFVALVPKQLIAGTSIADAASGAYASMAGLSQEKYMERFGVPLTPDGVGDAIVKIARGDAGLEGAAFTVTGKGIESL